MLNELEVDVYKLDRHMQSSFVERVNLQAKYNDAVCAFVVCYKGHWQQASGNFQQGFSITIF